MLTTGDHFGMRHSLVYCRLHFETLIQGEYQAHFNHAGDVDSGKGLCAGSAGNSLGLPYYNGVRTVQKRRPRKRKSPGPRADMVAYNAGKPSLYRLAINGYGHLNLQKVPRKENLTIVGPILCHSVCDISIGMKDNNAQNSGLLD